MLLCRRLDANTLEADINKLALSPRAASSSSAAAQSPNGPDDIADEQHDFDPDATLKRPPVPAVLRHLTLNGGGQSRERTIRVGDEPEMGLSSSPPSSSTFGEASAAGVARHASSPVYLVS